MSERAELVEFARAMPKAELHVHLEGTIEPRLARSLAERNRVELHLPPETPDSSYAFHDLPSFLNVYYAAMSVLMTSQDFEDLTMAYLSHAKDQNIVHVEIFFDPQAHTGRGVPFDVVLSGTRTAMLKAPTSFGISAIAIMCFLREESVDSAVATLDAALQSPYRDIIVGVGLDSNEQGNPPNKFKDVFQRVRSETSWRVTVHCDVDQENSIEHIRQAIEDIAVDRIDHGTNIIESERLVDKATKQQLGLTCCPLSNNVVCEGFKGIEMLNLARRGVLVTINSDDPAYFRGYVNESLELLIENTDVSRDELIQMQRNAFNISWIDDHERSRLLGMLDDYVVGRK